MKKFLGIAIALLSLIFGHIVVAETAMSRLSQQGRWLVDAQGRVVMLRGGNLSLPSYMGRKPLIARIHRSCWRLMGSTPFVWLFSSAS